MIEDKIINYRICLNKYIKGVDKSKYDLSLESEVALKQGDIIFLYPSIEIDEEAKMIPLEILKICPEFVFGKFNGYVCLVSKDRAEERVKNDGYAHLLE